MSNFYGGEITYILDLQGKACHSATSCLKSKKVKSFRANLQLPAKYKFDSIRC